MSDFSDENVNAFAKSVIGVRAVLQDFQAKAAEPDDQAAPADFKKEKTAALVAKIESHGLSLDEYNSIARATKIDPTLRQRIESLLHKAR